MKNKGILSTMSILFLTAIMLFGCGNEEVAEKQTTPVTSESVEEIQDTESVEESETTEEVESVKTEENNEVEADSDKLETSVENTSETEGDVSSTDGNNLSESEKYEMLKNITIPDKEYTEWELNELEATAQILREMGEKPEQYLELSKNMATEEGPGQTYFYEWAVEELIGWENIPKEIQEIIHLD